ncbi:TPA: hypothetical protein I7682_17970 [Vibrio vulnificus]|nr:hypothetical protein [Vibrio vulnificus]
MGGLLGIRKTWQRDYKLRPNIEAVTGTLCTGFGGLAAAAGTTGWSTPMLSNVSAAVMIGLGINYLNEGLDQFRYKNALWKNAPFWENTLNLPGNAKQLYLGRGFRWTKEHTQRLYDIEDAERSDKDLAKPPRIYYTARKLERLAKKLKLTPIAKALAEDFWFNPYPNLPTGDEDERNPRGKPYLHGINYKDSDFFVPFADLNSHMLVLGTTRVGKTRSAEVMVTQDIQRHSDSATILIDPKGDLELALRMYMEAKRAGKVDKFYFFHLAHQELSCRYNGIAEFNRITEVATRITQPLGDGGNSKAFKDFAWLFINTTQKAVFKMGRIASYVNIQAYLSDAELLASDYVKSLKNDEFEALIEAVAEQVDFSKVAPADKTKSARSIAIKSLIQDPPDDFRELITGDKVLMDVAKVLQYDKTYYDKITASAMPHLSKLTTGKVSEVISPNYENLEDPRPILDLRKVIREGGIVYIGLDAQTDGNVASAVGNSFLSELLSVSGEIYNHGVDQGIVTLPGAKPRQKALVRLHVDEANEVFGDEFNPILNKSGGSGIMVTAYTQSLSDLDVRLGDKAKSNQALGNFGTIVIFRVRGSDTTKYFVDQMPTVQVMKATPDSRVMDGQGDRADGQFKSSNGDSVNYESVPLIPANAFLELPKGQAFVFSSSQWFKVKMPLLEKEDDMPESVHGMMRDLEQELGHRVTLDYKRAA